MRVDVHQHIWTDPLLARLSARRDLPRVRHSDGRSVLHSTREHPHAIDVASETAEERAMLVRRDNLDLALISISSPIGIEALPRDDALELIDAHLEGVAALPHEFAAWGPIALDDADTDQVDQLLARGCVGISLPAGALAGPDRLARLGEILERTAARGVPLFVHPGPGLEESRAGEWLFEPPWWRALTDYVGQMQAAWLTFAAFGRRQHPRLVVIFAMLAGGAPLLGERLRSRGGPPIDMRDPLVFYETSSYGPAAIDLTVRLVGERQLVYGSDRPVIEPNTTRGYAPLQANAAPLFPSLAVAV